MKRTIDQVQTFVTKHCAPYEVRDTHGTCIHVWTFTGALEWVAVCSEVATVVHRGTGQLVASRSL